MRKNILLSLVLCCTLWPNAQAIPSRAQIMAAILQGLNPQTRDQFFSCNKWLAATKGIDSGAEGLRIMCMNSKDAKTIRAAAIASLLTSALVIGTKLFSAHKQKRVYDLEPLLYLYPALSIGRNAWDLVKAYKIAKNAERVALNNKKKKDHSDNKTVIPLCLLAAETALTLATHHTIHGTKPKIDQLIGRRATMDLDAGSQALELLGSQFLTLVTKGLSFILWASRQAYEARNLTITEQFVTNIEDFEVTKEDNLEELER